MNITYLIYEAERPRSMAEQRAADERAGQLASAVARLGHSLTHRAPGKRDGRRPARTTISRAIPRPRVPADR